MSVFDSRFVMMYDSSVMGVGVVVVSGNSGLMLKNIVCVKLVIVYVSVIGRKLCGCYLNSSSLIVSSMVVIGVLNMVVMLVVVLVMSSVLCLVVVMCMYCVISELSVLFVMMIGFLVLNGLLLLIMMLDDSGLRIVIFGDMWFLLNRIVLIVFGMLWL